MRVRSPRSIWFQETHNSTALEGNTLALSQVESLLKDGHKVDEGHHRQVLEVRGYADGVQWVDAHAVHPEDRAIPVRSGSGDFITADR
jgi:hypothetical protein